jgi:hypothetical protein
MAKMAALNKPKPLAHAMLTRIEPGSGVELSRGLGFLPQQVQRQRAVCQA